MRFRGRTSHSLLDGDVLLADSHDLLELAEGLPDVALVMHPAERLGLVPPSDIGVPKVRCGHDGKRPVIDVELRFDPTCAAGRSGARCVWRDRPRQRRGAALASWFPRP